MTLQKLLDVGESFGAKTVSECLITVQSLISACAIECSFADLNEMIMRLSNLRIPHFARIDDVRAYLYDSEKSMKDAAKEKAAAQDDCLVGARIHVLKIQPKYFEDVESGKKKFEIRKDDREYSIGNTVQLCECSNGLLTGNMITVKISYVLRNCPEYGLKDGYCIFCWE